MRLSLLPSLVLVLAVSTAAHADTLTATSTGWCEAGGCNSSGFNSGLHNNDSRTDINNFFTFSLAPGQTITSATLNIYSSAIYGASGHFGDGDYTVTGVNAFNFAGLDDGNEYGSIASSLLSGGSFQAITIDAAGLAALNAAAGGSFTFGGNVGGSSLDAWGYTSGSPVAFLDVNEVPANVTPEPSSLTLLGTGLIAGVAAVRRRFKR